MSVLLERVDAWSMGAKVTIGLAAAWLTVVAFCLATLKGYGSTIWSCTMIMSAVVFAWMWSTSSVLFQSSPLYKAIAALSPASAWRVMLIQAIIVVKVVSRAVLILIYSAILAFVLDVVFVKRAPVGSDERIFMSMALIVNQQVTSFLAYLLAIAAMTMLATHAWSANAMYRVAFANTNDASRRMSSVVKHSDCIIASALAMTCILFTRYFDSPP